MKEKNLFQEVYDLLRKELLYLDNKRGIIEVYELRNVLDALTYPIVKKIETELQLRDKK